MKIGERRLKLRKEFWPDEHAWTGKNEKGWFPSPRTLPLVLALLGSKELSGKCDPSRVYLELLARHISDGVVEMAHEGEHAFAAGYVGNRAVRTWQERMRLLEKNGFIKTKAKGNQLFGLTLLVHPTVVVQRLRDAGKVPDRWWNAYRARLIETGARSFKDLEREKGSAKVVTMKAAKANAR
jgi:hypothetical protein